MSNNKNNIKDRSLSYSNYNNEDVEREEQIYALGGMQDPLNYSQGNTFAIGGINDPVLGVPPNEDYNYTLGLGQQPLPPNPNDFQPITMDLQQEPINAIDSLPIRQSNGLPTQPIGNIKGKPNNDIYATHPLVTMGGASALTGIELTDEDKADLEDFGEEERQRKKEDEEGKRDWFMPFTYMGGLSPTYEAYSAGQFFGKENKNASDYVGGVASLLGMGLNLGRNFMSGFANTKETQKARAYYRRKLMERNYTPDSTYEDVNHRGGSSN